MIINFNIGSNGGGVVGYTIHAEGSATVEGYSVPELTGSQILAAYNAIVAGGSVTIADENDNFFYKVINVDTTSSTSFAVTIYFGSSMMITYLLEGETVEITAEKLGSETILTLNDLSSLIGQDDISRTAMEDAGWTTLIEEKLLSGDYSKINYFDGQHTCMFPFTSLVRNETNWRAEFNYIAIELKDDGDYKIEEI